jgi:hypothetical protein
MATVNPISRFDQGLGYLLAPHPPQPLKMRCYSFMPSTIKIGAATFLLTPNMGFDLSVLFVLNYHKIVMVGIKLTED